MFRAEWKAAYETGHQRIDFEHRIFLDLIRQIEAELTSDAPVEKISRRLTELYKYADFHFFSEEGIMLDLSFPEYDAHRKIHLALLDELSRFILSMSIDLIRQDDLIGFLVNWFSSHTAREDIKIADFTRARIKGQE
ncbi:bacteriohemerythrin [Magnetospirillum fulvum]|uniref:Hemerythrin-like metal-binding protein n=1 Tax=Magnetospirillum fulvum MGU-K5 TaxID=1316936 RepID=S9S775_MAGFU|nr:hemerythrin domain-containing protein [Magnetospirillum fulvum]EPY01717.1 hemerythrin-like metal-binding protein [Magnetospirillum fulvum MGU-K5]